MRVDVDEGQRDVLEYGPAITVLLAVRLPNADRAVGWLDPGSPRELGITPRV
jgi:hypothetical protein